MAGHDRPSRTAITRKSQSERADADLLSPVVKTATGDTAEAEPAASPALGVGPLWEDRLATLEGANVGTRPDRTTVPKRFDDDGNAAEQTERSRLRPSEIICRAILCAIFDADPAQDKEFHAGQVPPGITALIVPDSAWLSPLTRSLHAALHPTASGCAINCAAPDRIERDDDRHEQVGSVRRQAAPSDAIVIICRQETASRSNSLFREDGEARPRREGGDEPIAFDDLTTHCRQAAMLLWQGHRIVYLVPSLNDLPPRIRQAIDHRHDVRLEPTPLLSRLMATLYPGEPCPVASEGPVLDPDALDLAWRRHQAAETYLRRIGWHVSLPAAVRTPLPSPPGFPDRLENVLGMNSARDWGLDLVADLAALRRGELAAGDVDRGCVFTGPPGTGKTRLASLIAREAGLPFIAASYTEWQRMGKLDDVLQAMHATFTRARAETPSLLFLDEIDGFWTRSGGRDHNSSYMTGILTALLQELDGVVGREGVIVIGATNRVEDVDPALLRPGRLERVIEVRKPNFEAMRDLLVHYAGSWLTEAELDQAAMEAIRKGATGADCERWARGLRRRCRKAGHPPTFADLMAEIAG